MTHQPLLHLCSNSACKVPPLNRLAGPPMAPCKHVWSAQSAYVIETNDAPSNREGIVLRDCAAPCSSLGTPPQSTGTPGRSNSSGRAPTGHPASRLSRLPSAAMCRSWALDCEQGHQQREHQQSGDTGENPSCEWQWMWMKVRYFQDALWWGMRWGEQPSHALLILAMSGW